MSNGLKWRFNEPSMYSYEQADELSKAIQDTGVVKDSEVGMLSPFCVVLVHTCSVTFDAARARSDSLKKLPDFLSTWETLTPAQLWEYRRRHISNPLWVHWVKDFNQDSGRLMADAAELPEGDLTPEERDEAARPGSPLP